MSGHYKIKKRVKTLEEAETRNSLHSLHLECLLLLFCGLFVLVVYNRASPYINS